MDARNEAINTSTFEPYSELIQEDDCNTLILYLPGFTKEQLKVQLTRTRVLKISGARLLNNNTLNSFQKDFPVAENCDANKITAKFEDGILYVRQPKDENKLLTPVQTPKPAAKIVDSPPTPINKTGDSDIKQTAPPTKPVQSESGHKEEKKKSGSADEKTAAVANKQEAEGKESSGENVEADYNKLNAASPAARLKDARKKMTNILVLLCVFALGLYATKLPWFSKRAGD